jgi:SAM-dependent methyltransferase
MLAPEEWLHICKLPREPFLFHSYQLLNKLTAEFLRESPRILELGCGPNSPLLSFFASRWPGAPIHQIDALEGVVSEAAKWNPLGKVEQMYLTDLGSIASGSKDLVIAMSVFDQNPEMNSGKIAAEIHRVLADDGVVVYIHNEELNLPATADSFARRPSNSRLLVPSPIWSHTNDNDYSSGERQAIEAALTTQRSELAPLYWYLRGIYPRLYDGSTAADASGKVTVPFLRDCNAAMMAQIRDSVRFLQEVMHIPLVHHSTSDLLKNLLNDQLFSEENGFRTLVSDTFEIRHRTLWSTYFGERPPVPYFIRGLTRFGYTTSQSPLPVARFRQELNDNPSIADDETLFVAYQYGLLAHKLH